MPNTTNFNWPTPADTDLVKDGAAAIRNLGNGVDTSLVDLKGGTTGQILSKASNADMDFTFVTPNVGDLTEVQAGVGISVASGTGPIPIITNSSTDLITTAGDLLYGTAADTVARLGIGTAGQVLKVNSGATAPEWGAASGAAYVGVQANRNSGSQSISNNTYTAITFPSEGWDTDGFHDTSSNTSRITIPAGKGGKYQFTFMGNFNSNVTTSLYTSIYKNGSALTGEGLDSAGTLYNERGNADSFIGAITVDAVATDYFEIYVYQDSGGTTKTISNARLTADYLGA
jgi:hypothetical protein